MLRPSLKNVLRGVLATVACAYVYALLLLVFSSDFLQETLANKLRILLFIPLYMLLVTSWFVLPMGGVLGAVLPSLVRGRSGREAFVRGMALGVFAGILAACLTTLWMNLPSPSASDVKIVDREAWLRGIRRDFMWYLLTMTPLCAVWVAVWAYRWRKRS